MQTVESGDHVRISKGILSGIKGQRTGTGDGQDVLGIVGVVLLALGKTIHHITGGLVHLLLCFRGFPFEGHQTVRQLDPGFLGLAGGLGVDESHFGLEGGITVVFLLKHRTVIAGVVDNCRGIPLATALHIGKRTLYVVFRAHLMRVGVDGVDTLHRPLHILTDIQWTLAAIVVPPVAQHLVVCHLGTKVPVNLGNEVIHPTLVLP